MTRVSRAPDDREAEERSHCCPGCGAALRHFERYPWYFCRACLDQAEDADGRKLVFFNTSLAGGLGWQYADDPSLADCNVIEVMCYIRRRPVLVIEARFGGVVAQPLTSERPDRLNRDLLVDLTDRSELRTVREKLVPFR